MDLEDQAYYIIKMQSLLRKYRARKICLAKVESIYEKIYDPKRKRYFYYHRLKDMSSWRKPKILGKNDISKISPLYSREQSVGMIQRQFRRMKALHRVRMKFQKRVKATKDPKLKKIYYFNKITKQTFWELPEFMAGKINYDYDIDSGDENEKKKKKKKTDSESDEDDIRPPENNSEDENNGIVSGSEDSEGSGSESDTSEVKREKRQARRKYPRYLSLILGLSTFIRPP